MDRRIQKTRLLIMDTFVDLLVEKGFEKITINDIAERANINRGTVYLHYVDKFDLLEKCVDKYMELLLNHCANNADKTLDISAFQSVFEYMEKNYTLYKLLLGYEGFGNFSNRLYAVIAQSVTEVIGLMPDNNGYSNDVAAHFLTSGFIGTLKWWINHSMPNTAQEMTEQLLLLLEPYTKHLVAKSPLD